MTIPAFPLQWPTGWPRTPDLRRHPARFNKRERETRTWRDGTSSSWMSRKDLSIADATSRVRAELAKMGLSDDDIVISSNLALRLDGLPRSGQSEPDDPGIAVYWRAGGATRCMAIDRYERTADNLAAIAATLEAMRAIERHGGAEILDRAFTGFTALPAAAKPWHVVLGVPAHTSTADVEQAYKRARGRMHPDAGGDAELFDQVQRAYAAFRAERGLA